MANVKLQEIRQNEAIDQNTHPEFWYRLQLALLLALQEQGTLSFTACSLAEERLQRHHHGRSAL